MATGLTLAVYGLLLVAAAIVVWQRPVAALYAWVVGLAAHNAVMLVDPLGPRPIVVTGSANFSKASTETNDENMLVIRGDKRIADIYFGEYLRLYSHYAFREAVKIYLAKKKGGKPEEWTPQFLVADDSWMDPYFDPHDRSARDTRRKYFGGPMSVSQTPH